MNYLGSIADTLTEAGHNVTVFCPEMNVNIKQPCSKKSKIISYPADDTVLDLQKNNTASDDIWVNNESPIEQLKQLETLFLSIFLESLDILYDEEITKVMKNEKFDFAIAEGLNLHAFGFFKVWGIKSYASASSTSLLDIYYKYFGMAFPSSIVPSTLNRFSKKITYTERFNNFISYLSFEMYERKIFEQLSLQTSFNAKYGADFFDAIKAFADSSFMFLNSNPILNGAGPKTPKMIEIGGIALPEVKPLNNYWDGILSKRKVNILISFGSILKSNKMPRLMKNGIIETIKRMPNCTFIWKYDDTNDDIGRNVDNLILEKWIPQYDIINDGRLTLLISHAGMNSLFEMAFSGTISLNIPVCSDQFSNAKIAENHGIGKVFSKAHLYNPDKLYQALQDVLSDKEMYLNSKLMSLLLKKHPLSSKELLVKYVEYGAEFGLLPQLDLKSRDMGFVEYYNLDIIFPILLLFNVIVITTVHFVIKFIISKFVSKKKIE